jgi:Na+-translocating ferredoxin:NAD+ oxidoreductase RnfG subunit
LRPDSSFTQVNIAFAAIFLVASSSAFAVDYMTADEASKLLMPGAVQWQDSHQSLSLSQMQAIAKLAQVPARSAAWKLRHAFDARQKYLGSVVIDQVLGKFELISYAVGLDASGAVTGIEILSYRESHGGEVRLLGWRKQFVGKTALQPLRVGDDIALISGATLSCQHITDGVRRIVALASVLRSDQLLPV